jgi:hypothetical protein
VRHLVQQHLVDLVILVAAREVPRHGDALLAVVAQPGTGAGVIEPEGPRGVEVQGDEGIRPSANAVEVCH